MSSPTDDSASGRQASSSDGLGWVKLNEERMRSRQWDYARRLREAGEREATRLSREEDELQAYLSSVTDRDNVAGPARSAAVHRDRRDVQPRRRPIALVQRIYAENLKSFAGRHDIPLAPLTLVYGPNSAGKSTVLNGLRLFMHAVDEGRFDALNLWRRAFPDLRPERVITWEGRPEDLPFSQTRTLTLGVTYAVEKTGKLATAELGFQESDVGPWQSSAMGFADDGEVMCKEFFLNFDAADHVYRDDFGDVLRKWEVREWSGRDRPDAEPRGFDYRLFGHPDATVQGTLFRLAGQLSHFSAHRGDPGDKYVPADLNDIAGPDHWDFAGAPRWGIAGFHGYEVLNQALEQLGIDHRFDPIITAEAGRVSITDWQLIDSRSGAPVSLAEVGYGVSQLLPIIDVCLIATQRIICVEEPELHLHPRLQAKLGNLFAASVLRRGNQLIVETNSESILLRVRRLIRQGKLRPDDVAVLYVDNSDADGAHARRLRLGEKGELLDPWPTGFFDDRLADVLGVSE